ncbi:TPA: hypothetical protein IOH86_000207 [Salmonella enterica]|nr:hypothetical protein [Salmonella enterica]HAO4198307.1 hypothetical protein [Salmonella enterica]
MYVVTASGAVFPAPAGINRDNMEMNERPTCVPRASGDKPFPGNLFQCYWGCSPRQRG